jgi:hypothetical protein
MLKDYNGKKVDTIYWPGENKEVGIEGEGHELTCHYHGEHGDLWIMETYDGKEVAAHNMKYIESVVWVV